MVRFRRKVPAETSSLDLHRRDARSTKISSLNSKQLLEHTTGHPQDERIVGRVVAAFKHPIEQVARFIHGNVAVQLCNIFRTEIVHWYTQSTIYHIVMRSDLSTWSRNLVYLREAAMCRHQRRHARSTNNENRAQV